MNQDKYIEVVGAYLDNELKGDELKQFEKELSSNPGLQKELSFQKELHEGIKLNRHNQLKARLDNLEVSGGSTGTSALVKVVGGIAIAGLVGLGIYLVNTNETLEPAPINETSELVENTPKEETTSPSTIEENEIDEPVESTISNPIETSDPVNEQATTSSDMKEDESSDIDTSLPIADLPDVEEGMDDMESMEDVDIASPSISMDKSVSSGQSNISVEIKRKKKYDFHYEFTEDRMVLYGKFNEEPYELIEVNLADGKKIFMKYKDDYYAIEPTTEITPLKVITDQSLIQKIKDIDK